MNDFPCSLTGASLSCMLVTVSGREEEEEEEEVEEVRWRKREVLPPPQGPRRRRCLGLPFLGVGGWVGGWMDGLGKVGG